MTFLPITKILLSIITFPKISLACTNLLVTPSASTDGNPMIAYNADSGELMGSLYHYGASSHNTEDQELRSVFSWDYGIFLGKIPEADVTYNVVGNTNEHGLVIAETTFGGLEILSHNHQPSGIIDYGSLIYITLQRSRDAKEAIDTMVYLMDTYGYASDGESFSIADRFGNVWIMEVIGRGETGKKGAVWVAMKVPDGYVAAHSNQARITVFPRDDPENCLYSDDVVDLAKQIGVYEQSENDPQDLLFSFSDTYDPVTFMGARASDARTWSIFSSIAKEETDFESTYLDYVQGTNPTNRMPLWIEPKHKLSFEDVSELMSSHYEGTPLSFDSDVGAGIYGSPYRPRPLEWKYEDETYFNERAVATQQTGWNFIATVRLDMPPPISSILWFAVDDSSTSPRYPVYGCSTSVSPAYGGYGTQDGVVSPLLSFDLTKAFWVQNMVSNLVYSRWKDSYDMVREKINSIETTFQAQVRELDLQLIDLLKSSESSSLQDIVNEATNFSVKAGDELHKEWMVFYGTLFARLRDFYIITPDPTNPVCNCKVGESGFDEEWKERVVTETGSRYKCIDDDEVPDINLRSSGGSKMKTVTHSTTPTTLTSDKTLLKAMK